MIGNPPTPHLLLADEIILKAKLGWVNIAGGYESLKHLIHVFHLYSRYQFGFSSAQVNIVLHLSFLINYVNSLFSRVFDLCSSTKLVRHLRSE